MHFWQKTVGTVLLSLLIAGGGWVFLGREITLPKFKTLKQLGELHSSRHAQFMFVERVPEPDGEMCHWNPSGSEVRLASLFQQENVSIRTAASDSRNSVTLERPAIRAIRDPFPTYSAVTVDLKNNEIILQDENLLQIMVYDRTANTPPRASMTEPKRVIGGSDAQIEYNCGLYVDPKNGDIYSVNNDALKRLTVFSRNAKGNVPPNRQLRTPMYTYGIGVDEAKEELFLTVQAPPMVVVYYKYASGEDKPIRVLRGDKAGLADPRGIALDIQRGLMFVANSGVVSDYKQKDGDAVGGEIVPASGRFESPSIAVFDMKSAGNTPPLRVIRGSRTRLNLPAHIYVDEEHEDLYVANDGDDSILVFRTTDSGDVAPSRVLKGAKTQMKNPAGIYVDKVNDELIVANMGNHRATVYRRTASGDTAPIRTIRAAPDGTPALQIANPGAVAFDTKRDQILVPN